MACFVRRQAPRFIAHIADDPFAQQARLSRASMVGAEIIEIRNFLVASLISASRNSITVPSKLPSMIIQRASPLLVTVDIAVSQAPHRRSERSYGRDCGPDAAVAWISRPPPWLSTAARVQSAKSIFIDNRADAKADGRAKQGGVKAGGLEGSYSVQNRAVREPLSGG